MLKDVARQFDASRPTVTRWRNGSNTPHAALHPAIYTWMLDEAKARLRRLDQAMTSPDNPQQPIEEKKA